MRAMTVPLTGALKRIFGFDAFRPGQEAVVRDVLAGRDVLALMPTGGGKSLCPNTGEPLMNEQRIARQQLRQVLNYAESSECRRAIQLHYFDEAFTGPCEACDNCCEPHTTHDYSVEARQFLSCIARLAQRGERFGAAYIIEILRGARTERLQSRGHDSLSVYGIGKHRSVDEWRSLARALTHQRLDRKSVV